MDLLLDTVTHDMVFTNGGTSVTSQLTEIVAQRLKIKLLTFKGEWILNTEFGIPYFTDVFGKVSSKTYVDAIFQKAIIETEGVTKITSFYSEVSNSRHYVVTFSVSTSSGETVTITIG